MRLLLCNTNDILHKFGSATRIASGISLTKATLHQEQSQDTSMEETKPPAHHQHIIEPKPDNRTLVPPHQNTQLQQTHQDPTKYIYTQQQQDHHQHQHQFIHENIHYIPTHSAMPSYHHPLYATQQQIHPQVDHQQYSMYLLPVTQTPPYNVAQPSTIARAQPPAYPTRAAATPTNNQFQQYVGYNAANYGHFDYGHNQVYYTGQLQPTASAVNMTPSQYQSITPAQAAMITEATLKLPTNIESNKQPPTS